MGSPRLGVKDRAKLAKKPDFDVEVLATMTPTLATRFNDSMAPPLRPSLHLTQRTSQFPAHSRSHRHPQRNLSDAKARCAQVHPRSAQYKRGREKRFLIRRLPSVAIIEAFQPIRADFMQLTWSSTNMHITLVIPRSEEHTSELQSRQY